MDLNEMQSEPHRDLETLLRRALAEEGITLVPKSVLGASTATLDVTVKISIEGAATSIVDATYEKLSVLGMSDVRKTLGNCLMLLGCGHIEVMDTPFGCPTSYLFKDCIFAVGEAPEPKRNIQTTYLAMQGIYPDLPPFSKLTLDQRKMIRNHVEMLADYLRK